MRRRGAPALAGALLVCLISAGCGGDDDPAPLSREDFISRADAICRAGDARLRAASADLGPTPGRGRIARFASSTLVPNMQSQVDQIDELRPPEADEDTVAAILDAAQAGVNQIEQNPAVLAERDADPFAEASQLARDYGLRACGE